MCMDGLGQEAVRRYWPSWFARDGLLEVRADLLEECPVFRLGLGDANLNVRAAPRTFQERVSQNHLDTRHSGAPPNARTTFSISSAL